MFKTKHRLLREKRSGVTSGGKSFTHVFYLIQRKPWWCPFFYTTCQFNDYEMAKGAYERSLKTGHSEIFKKDY